MWYTPPKRGFYEQTRFMWQVDALKFTDTERDKRYTNEHSGRRAQRAAS